MITFNQQPTTRRPQREVLRQPASLGKCRSAEITTTRMRADCDLHAIGAFPGPKISILTSGVLVWGTVNKAVGLSWLTRVSWVRNWLESLFLTLSQLESAYLQRYLHFGYHIFIFGIPEWEVGRRRKQENKWFVSSQKWYMLKCQ